MNTRTLGALLLWLIASMQAMAGSNLDTAFGSENGFARFDVPLNSHVANSFQVSNGKYISITTEAFSSTVVDTRVNIRRYSKSGALDTSYNSTGVLQLTIRGISGFSEVVGSTLQYPDGSVLIMGTVQQTVPPTQTGTGTNPVLFLYKLQADGTPDMAFGTDALLTYADTSLTHCESVVDSKYFVDTTAGDFVVLCNPDFGTNIVVLLKFYKDGSLYSNFGNSGAAFVQISPYSVATPVAVAVSSTTAYVGLNLTGQASNVPLQAGLMRVDSRGIWDQQFGPQGVVLMSESHKNIEVNDIAVNSFNPVAVLTYHDYPNPGEQRVVVWQFKNSGSTMTTFGPNGNGKVFYGSATQPMSGVNIIAQPNTRILVVSNANCQTNSGCDIVASRLKADGSNDSLFSASGAVTAVPQGSNKVHTLRRTQVNKDGSMLMSMDVVPSASNTTDPKQIVVASFVPDQTTPRAFTFAPQTNVRTSVTLTTETHQILDTDTAVVVTADDNTILFSINGGNWLSNRAIANPGDTLAIQYISSTKYSTTKTNTINVGNLPVTVSSTTMQAPPPPQDGGGAIDLLLLPGLAWLIRLRRRA